VTCSRAVGLPPEAPWLDVSPLILGVFSWPFPARAGRSSYVHAPRELAYFLTWDAAALRHRPIRGRVGRQIYPNKEYESYTWNAELTGSKATIHFLYSYKRDAALPVCVSAGGTGVAISMGLSSAAVVLSLAFYGVV